MNKIFPRFHTFCEARFTAAWRRCMAMEHDTGTDEK